MVACSVFKDMQDIMQIFIAITIIANLAVTKENGIELQEGEA